MFLLFFLQLMLSTKRMSVAGAGTLRSRMMSDNVDRSIQAYHNMNKFLAAFFEHVRRCSSVLDLIYKL